MIIKANENMHKKLTEISLLSKKIWNYSDEEMEIFKNELTITKDYIRKNPTYCLINNNEIMGYYSMVIECDDRYAGEIFIEKGLWIEHMFINPKHIGNGYGSLLFKNIEEIYKISFKEVKVFSDPNAVGFYKKLGFKILRMSKSSIKGREIPVLKYKLI